MTIKTIEVRGWLEDHECKKTERYIIHCHIGGAYRFTLIFAHNE